MAKNMGGGKIEQCRFLSMPKLFLLKIPGFAFYVQALGGATLTKWDLIS